MSVEIIAAIIIGASAIIAAAIQAKADPNRKPPTPLWRLLLYLSLALGVTFLSLSGWIMIPFLILLPESTDLPIHIMTVVGLIGILMTVFYLMRVIVRLIKIVITS